MSNSCDRDISLVEGFKEYYVERINSKHRDVGNLGLFPVLYAYCSVSRCSEIDKLRLQVLFNIYMPMNMGRETWFRSNDDRVDFLDKIVRELKKDLFKPESKSFLGLKITW